MNFFERQEQARGRTKLLVFLFICALFATFAAILALVAGFAALGTETSATGGATAEELFVRYLTNPALAGVVAVVVLLLIGGGSLFKIGELKSLGADGVAEALGGTRITRAATDPAERRLYNVVEEMAIASGVPVPSVYVMRKEKAINACAIGGDPESSAVAVTDGALRSLTRDELQGVVAHEFGHLLNGDVKMNMRLIGVLFGLQMLALTGLVIFRSTMYISLGGSSDNRKNGAGVVAAIWFFALGLIVIGSIGVFFSNVIRAAISRQREFLADASAAQFTRNPAGLAGALKKIGALAEGSEVNAARSAEMAHLFFGSVFSGGLTASLFKTHPDLTERIRRLEPTFDGRFPKVAVDSGVGGRLSVPLYDGTPASVRGLASGSGMNWSGTNGASSAERFATGAAVASALIDSIATQAAEKLDVAGALLQRTPPQVEPLLADFDGARAVLYALLADEDKAVQKRQLETIRGAEGTKLDAKIAVAFQALVGAAFATRSTVARLTLPALKTANIVQYRKLRQTILELCAADGTLDLFEYALQASVVRELDVYYRLSRGTKIRFSRFEDVLEPFRLVLTYLAGEGAPGDRAAAREAFDEGASYFYLELEPTPPETRTLGAFSRALNDLSQATPTLKGKMLEAFYRCVAADGVVVEREGELLEAIASALGVPAPVWSALGV
ncbi:MAG: M48 family metallopeptidase [Thermoguttaceae bacterium]|nr:M48 family metallopeptidase [Thermoguttaceae bacterium]